MRWCTRQLKIRAVRAVIVGDDPTLSAMSVMRADENRRSGYVSTKENITRASIPFKEDGIDQGRDVIPHPG